MTARRCEHGFRYGCPEDEPPAQAETPRCPQCNSPDKALRQFKCVPVRNAETGHFTIVMHPWHMHKTEGAEDGKAGGPCSDSGQPKRDPAQVGRTITGARTDKAELGRQPSDSLAQDDKEVMPDEVRNAGREVNIAATVGKRAAPGVANGGGASGLAQDEIDRRIIAAIDAHYCWCQRCIDGITPCVGANAVDALASLARRLLKQVQAYEGMDKAVDVYRERAEVAERLHDAHCMESGIPKVPDCRPPWRTGR